MCRTTSFSIFTFLVCGIVANDCSTSDPTGAIVQLLVQRIQIADKVAAAKWVANSAIEDPKREKQILATVATKAQKIGIDVNWAQTFFNDQFLASKSVQYDFFAKWRATKGEKIGQSSKNIPKIDLATEVRPKIDEIDTKLFSWFQQNLKSCNFQANKLQNIAKTCYRLDNIHSKALQKAVAHLKC